MRRSSLPVLLGAGAAIGLFVALISLSGPAESTAPKAPPRPTRPAPPAPKSPAPKPPPAPCPHCPRAAAAGYLAVGQASGGIEQDGPEHNGTQVTCDLPVSLRLHNVGGRDGAGLCVFTSIMHAGRYQNERKVWDFQKQMTAEPGGGYPSKVDAMIKKYCPGTQYLQYEGQDPSVMELALKTGRMPCVTWGGNHMLNLVYLDASTAAILDNNHVGEKEIMWMSRDTFLQHWKQGGGAWCVVLLAPRPPAPPRNAQATNGVEEEALDAAQPPARVYGQAPASHPVDELRWNRVSSDEWLLWHGSTQLGSYHRTKGYKPWDAQLGWGPVQEPPVALPPEACPGCDCGPDCHCGPDCKCPGCQYHKRPRADIFGVISEYISRTERLTLNGRVISRSNLVEALGDVVPDDSARPSLTVIGVDTERQRVLADLAQSDLHSRVVVQDYEPASAMLQCGFVVSPAGPTIYLQQPDGAVLARLDGYHGPADLESLVQIVRQPDPNYHPDQDPNPTRSPVLAGIPSDHLILPGVLGCAALALGGVALTRRK